MGNKLICACEGCNLRSIFFLHVNSELMETVCETKTERQFEKGEIIISEGDKIRDFTYLKSGLVKLSKRGPDGKDQILCFAKPFDFVSLISVFSSASYNFTVTAIEVTIICSIQLNELMAIAKGNGEFAMDLMIHMSEASDKIILNNLEIRRKNLKGRVAFMILYFAKQVYYYNKFELPVSRREIAEYIGMSTENVIRAMSEFRKDNILRFYGKEIEIINEKLLEDIAHHG